MIGEALESVDGTTYLAESADGGATWSEPRQIFDKTNENPPFTDTCKITWLGGGEAICLGYGYPRNDPSLPEKVSKPIDGIGDFPVSKGVVSLTNDQGTSYNMYVQVQNELQRAVNELRDETALQYFGKKFDGLDSAAQRAVSSAIPMSISEAPPIDYSNPGK